jgi:hypothetical protein
MNIARKKHPLRVVIVSAAMYGVAIELFLAHHASAIKSNPVRRNARRK